MMMHQTIFRRYPLTVTARRRMMCLLVEDLVFHPTLLWEGFPASDQVHLDGIPRMMQPLEAPPTNPFGKHEMFSEASHIGATIVGTQT